MTIIDPSSEKYHYFSKDIRTVLGNEAIFFDSINPDITSSGPIGVFDSGVGGLSVLQHLVAKLPNEKFIYLADTKHVPYGERSFEEIEELTQSAVAWLYQQGCKLVVVACNSASTHSLPNLRAFYKEQLPIVGLVPALKPAVQATQTKKVAVLATKATLNGYLLNQVIDEIATPANVCVSKYHLPNLVPWVESGLCEKHQAFSELCELLENIQQNEEDQLVLGCTHYLFFKDKIMKNAAGLHIVDSGAAIARRVENLLMTLSLTKAEQNIPFEKKPLKIVTKMTKGHFLNTNQLFLTTKGDETDKNMIKQLLNREITSHKYDR